MPAHPRHTVAVLIAALAWLGPAALAAAPAAARESGRAASVTPTVSDAEYAAAISKCATRQHVEAITDAARWTAAGVVPAAERFASTELKDLARAVALHLEVAGLVSGEPARAHRGALFVAASRLERGDMAVEPLRHEAVLAAIAELQGALDVVGVASLVGRGLAVWPLDPALLLARGAMQETTLAMPGTEGREGTRLRAAASRAAARAAIVDYSVALVRDPGLHEARLRRGHLYCRLGRTADAVADLERVIRDAPDPALVYLAYLFLGQTHEEAGRFEEADGAYETARTRMEDAQAPYLALSHLRSRQGRVVAAGTVIAAMTARARSAITDPWWVYDFGQFWDRDRRLARLRDEVGP